MNTGIQDVYNLAWKLAMVLDGKCGEKLLDSYNEERLPNADMLLKTTDRFFNLVASPEPVLTYLRMHVFPYIAGAAFSFDAVKKFVFPRISQIGISYRDSSLSEHEHDGSFNVRAGDRMPYFVIDGASIYDRLREPKFHVISFSDGQETNAASATLPEIADHHRVPLFPHIAEAFDQTKSFNVLLRPDNYISTISEGSSLAPIEDYLKRCL
jgi:hypothetical protein